MAERERIVLVMNISFGVHCLTTEENMKRMNRFHDDVGILYTLYLSANEYFIYFSIILDFNKNASKIS
jgi:hypothetical protein